MLFCCKCCFVVNVVLLLLLRRKNVFFGSEEEVFYSVRIRLVPKKMKSEGTRRRCASTKKIESEKNFIIVEMSKEKTHRQRKMTSTMMMMGKKRFVKQFFFKTPTDIGFFSFPPVALRRAERKN